MYIWSMRFKKKKSLPVRVTSLTIIVLEDIHNTVSEVPTQIQSCIHGILLCKVMYI